MRSFGVVVDDCVHRHMATYGKSGGNAYTWVKPNTMHFDGWKCYFQIQKPTSADSTKYSTIKLISSTTYEP